MANDINTNELIEALEVGSIGGTVGKAAAILDILDSLRWQTLQLESKDMGAGGHTAKREAVQKITEAYEAMARVCTSIQRKTLREA